MIRTLLAAGLLAISLSFTQASAQGPERGQPDLHTYPLNPTRLTLRVNEPLYSLELRSPTGDLLDPGFNLIPGAYQTFTPYRLFYSNVPVGYFDLGHRLRPDFSPTLQVVYRLPGYLQPDPERWAYFVGGGFDEPPPFLAPEPSGACIGLVLLASFTAFRRHWG